MPFNLAETFATFLRDPAELVDEDSIADLEQVLENLIDKLAASSQSITEEESFNAAQQLLWSYDSMDTASMEKLVDLILTGLQQEVRDLPSVLEGGDMIDLTKEVIERYSFLLHWYLISLEKYTVRKNTPVMHTGRKKPSNDVFDRTFIQLSGIMSTICDCLNAGTDKLFITSSERDLFAGLFLRPTYLFMENDLIMKKQNLKYILFNVVCLSVKLFSQQANTHTSLMQLLIYFDHLSETLAELFEVMYDKYGVSAILENMLVELSEKTFNRNDTKGPKFVSAFLSKVSQLVPAVLIRYMANVGQLLESESSTLRSSIIEAVGNLIVYLNDQESSEDEDVERLRIQTNSFIDLVEERVLDINPHCRSKALQTLGIVCGLKTQFSKRWLGFAEIAVQELKDKSNLVRRNAIKLLSKVISTHPFGQLHGSELTLSQWEERYDAVNKELDAIIPANMEAKKSTEQTMVVEGSDLDAPTIVEEQQPNSEEPEETESQRQSTDNEMINRLQLTKKYYEEAIEFIAKIHRGIETIELLLFSKNKNEVIDSMDFFVLADAYSIEAARAGIRKMIKLIWAKANNDEGQAIQSHLITCYQSLFFDTPVGISDNDASLLVARNLISLTYGATLAELASLEHLLVLAIEKEQLVNPKLIKTLWKIYGYQAREISKSQRRGAIIVLGMIAKADHSVALAGMELLLKIGLGEQGYRDLGLAKYSCIALQRCVGNGNSGKPATRFPITHDAVPKLANMLLMSTSSFEWFGVAEQAVKAVNDLCECPDEVFTEIIRHKTKQVFGGELQVSPAEYEAALSQLIFLAGEVALKMIIHLERCEAQFKRAKIAAEKTNASNRKKSLTASQQADEDLVMVGGGTSEDDFTEAVAYVRERELLYGENSLLARFGGLVSEICQRGLKTKLSAHLQVSSTLCLAKFMCVSARYCEENLITLVTLMEASDNSTIRSNCVLAIGDIAVCFSRILDDYTEFLYRRLHDHYQVVQRTCLMTLTFLILAGQVKVKGQLGEMAKCLEDPDKRIADLSRLFFTELATKDNAIYNGFIDMFSMLSADENLEQEALHRILKFLVAFIDKERQIKQLAEKLRGRLEKCDDKKTWDDIAYVLGVLPHKSEDINRLISEGFKYTEVRVE